MRPPRDLPDDDNPSPVILLAMNERAPQSLEDASSAWVIRLAPIRVRPWLQLMRADRPIGIWLLLLPCWQGLALAAAVEGWTPRVFLLAGLFLVGAVVMRGAGCALNDIADRQIDRQVQRTRDRPVASGAISPLGAAIFAAVLSLIGLAVLLQFNLPTITLGLFAVIPAAIYPLAKRYTHWPQLVLGIAFNWGALLGWLAYAGYLHWPPLLLYASGICWTLGYDTIYALVDLEDDRRAGIKSLAVRFGANSGKIIGVFYLGAVLLAVAAGYAAGLGLAFWLFLIGYADRLAYQLYALRIDDRDICLRVFRSNSEAGLLLLLAIATGML